MRLPPSRQGDLFEVDQKILDIPNTQIAATIDIPNMTGSANPSSLRDVGKVFRERMRLSVSIKVCLKMVPPGITTKRLLVVQWSLPTHYCA